MPSLNFSVFLGIFKIVNSSTYLNSEVFQGILYINCNYLSKFRESLSSVNKRVTDIK